MGMEEITFKLDFFFSPEKKLKGFIDISQTEKERMTLQAEI